MKAILLLALVQQDEVIPRASKQIYHPAVLSCEKAEGLIDSDPKEAIRLLDEILGNVKVEKRECRMKIVIQPGTESKWFEFYPYQFRGRASLKLSESAPGEDKVRHLDQAVQHLKKSVELGLRSSEPLLASAREKLERARLAAGGEDPEVPFRRGWAELVDAGRFAEAKAYAGARGSFLPEAKRAEYGAETEKRCLAAVARAADRFTAALARPDLRDPAALRPDDFELYFSLPAAETLVKTTPKFDWCVRMRATLAKVRSGAPALGDLCERAVEAAGAADAPDPLAVQASERLAWFALEAAVRLRSGEAQGAPAERRKVLQADAEGLVAQWGAFEKRLRAAAEGRPAVLAGVPARQPGALLAEFPVEASLDKIVAALEGSVTSDDPERALAETEKGIQKLLEGSDRLTTDSRRRVLTLAVITRSLRGFLSEETSEEIVRAARAIAPDLAPLGGPAEDVKRYGPKVAEIFKHLR